MTKIVEVKKDVSKFSLTNVKYCTTIKIAPLLFEGCWFNLRVNRIFSLFIDVLTHIIRHAG